MNSQATENGSPHNGWGGARPGAGRPRTWLSEEQAAHWGVLIEQPPRCVCGERDYRYKINDGLLHARCNLCDEEYVYDVITDRWVPAKFSTRVF